jgi:branched-chain amino acid transport system ATP-binding protein
MAPLLQLRNVCAGYGGVPVIRAVDLKVDVGEVVALVGPNGAGKTTTLNAIGGYVATSEGQILFKDSPMPASPHRRARTGVSYVNENRSVLRSLTTKENLKVARVDPDRCFGMFPELRARLNLKAGELSGGEQQMLTVSRALVRNADLFMADELSLGLAPLAAERVLRAVRDAADSQQLGVLLVEQHLHNVTQYADRVYLMVSGEIAFTGEPAELAASSSEIVRAYFGQTEDAKSKSGDTTAESEEN